MTWIKPSENVTFCHYFLPGFVPIFPFFVPAPFDRLRDQGQKTETRSKNALSQKCTLSLYPKTCGISKTSQDLCQIYT
ncbi:Uncharacterized protein dnm_053680 [Desulfonema magnum]|uniref:Uncharacterized protein n=1 Tax=Desulfonema magnum TaxID=45655 RepID=A0A975BPL7_9BACT|nr:Uncharacterized protein dnm_053680 [Desulfonema magnum]